MYKTSALRHCVACFLLAAALVAHAQAQAVQSVLWAVVFNGLPGDVGELFLQDTHGRVFASADFLARWNLRPPPLDAYGPDPRYADLRQITGLSYEVDARNAAIHITASAAAFLPSPRDAGQGTTLTPAPYAPGAFLNYDLSATQSYNDTSAQALISGGAFAGESLLTHSFALQNGATTRLLTTYQTDHFAQMKTLRLGDVVNTPGAWGQAVLFGGVQYGTNMALRPDFLTQSAPALSGTALLPSTVDVYVNNALRNQQAVPAGPFTISNLPVVQGSGEVALVVRDLLGREQRISQTFLSTPTLLREGLVQNTLEAGSLRRNLGVASNDYGEPFAAAIYRKGLRPSTTIELRGELQPGGATAGASLATLVPYISSVVEATLALSGGYGLAQTGALATMGYSLLGRAMAVNARLSTQTDSFRQVGSDITNLQRSVLSLQWVSPWAGGTLSANYVQRRNQADNAITVLNLAYGKRLSNRVVANAALLHTLAGNEASLGAYLGLTLLVDANQFASTTVSAQAGQTTAYADYQKSAPWGQGTGYRLAAQEGTGHGLQQASVAEHRAWGSLQAEVAQQAGTTSARVTATGGIATLGRGLHFSRGLGQSFAVVKVGDLPNIPVYLEHQEVARTGRDGSALVNNLRAFEVNHISLDPLTLPMDVSLASLARPVVPRSQGGVQVEFAAPRVHTLTLQLRDHNGSLLPAWTRVLIGGNAHAFVVGQRGEASVDLPRVNSHQVSAYPPNQAPCTWLLTQDHAIAAMGFLLPLRCGSDAENPALVRQ